MAQGKTKASAGTAIPARRVGLSAGDILDLTVAEIQQLLKETRGNRLRALKIGLRRLRTSGVLTDRDLRRLEGTCELVFLAHAGKRSHEAVASELRRLQQETILDTEASELAVTMISAVASRAKPGESISVLGLMGLIGGAALGLVTGLDGAALVGALVGAGVGAIAEACED